MFLFLISDLWAPTFCNQMATKLKVIFLNKKNKQKIFFLKLSSMI